MQHHAGILQQRVQVAAIGRSRKEALERVRGEQHEGEKTRAQHAHDAEHPRHHVLGQLRAERAHREHPDPEHQAPQKERALVAAPHAGDAVMQRQRAVRIHGDVRDREVVGHERPRQAAEGEGDEHRLRLRRRPRHAHPGDVAFCCTHQGHEGLDERNDKSNRERELAQFRNHLSNRRVFCAFSTACAASGGM
jgi:hypothetical protein